MACVLAKALANRQDSTEGSADDTPVKCMQAGELREYVLQEANVREVEICSDPLEYASVRAEPNYQVTFPQHAHVRHLDASGDRRSLHMLCLC